MLEIFKQVLSFHFAITFVQDASLITFLCSLSCYLNISSRSLPRNRLAAGSTAPLMRCTSLLPSRAKLQISESPQLPCDKAAIASVGCGETDYACHCAHSSQLQSIVVPCLQNSSNCSSSDLQSAPPLFLSELNVEILNDVRNSIRNSCQANMSES